MDIKFYYPRWGSENIPWREFLKNVKSNLYDGIEVYPLQAPGEKKEMLQLIEDNGLEYALLHTEMTEGRDFKKYVAALEKNLYELVSYQTKNNIPTFITSQTGREYYTCEQMAECFAICERISKESGIMILQETHRNKWSYAAHIVKNYLEKFPFLKLALDLSHWFCVSESYLQDQQEAIDLALDHTVHLHARIGHTQGPQVVDPRLKENEEALNYHLVQWDKWVHKLKKKNTACCTITPEFGPYPYMPFEYWSKKPSLQWELNNYIRSLLYNRYRS